MSKTEVVIGLNRKKLIVNVTVCAILAFAGLLGFFWIADRQEFASPIFFKTVGGLWFGFFVIIGGTHSKRLARKNAGLTLSREGMEDFTSSISVGLIKWKDITEIKLAKSLTSKLLLVEIRKPEKMIREAKNKAIRRLMKQNLNLYKTPIVINAKILNCSFAELENEVSIFFNRYAKK